LSACCTATSPAQKAGAQALSNDPAAVHARLLTLDTHVDVQEDIASADNDPGRITRNQVDLPKMRAGGLDAAFFILYSAQGPLTAAGYAKARATDEVKYAGIVRMTKAYPDQIVMAKTSAEARAAVAQGKLVAFLGMENAYPLGDSVADVQMWADRGVRYMGVTHFGHNQFGDSANPSMQLGDAPARWGGLSPLGKELVAAINKAGIMLDVSHAGRETMMQAVALSQAPIIASHSGAAAVSDNPRNLDDDQLRAIAKNGGVAQMVALAAYVKKQPPERIAAVDALRQRLGLVDEGAAARATGDALKAYKTGMAQIEAKWPQATVKDFVDHIDHAVQVAGVDHVGIASDFDGGGGITGWSDASETGTVTAELLKRGYSESDIAKIWGGNLLRVLDEVEKTGRRLRGEK
jgi:membrane dipeptidase